MVINIGRLKNKEYDAVREDIRAVKEAVGAKMLKVIIETCLLTDEEKEKRCDIVCEAGADYIKTLSLIHISMFRTIGLYALRAGKDPKDNEAVNTLLPEIELHFAFIDGCLLYTSRCV